MNTRTRTFTAVVVAAFAVACGTDRESSGPKGPEISRIEAKSTSGSLYTVVFSGQAIPANAAADIAAAGGTIVDTIPELGLALVSSSNSKFTSKLKGVSGVSSAGSQRSQAVPNGTWGQQHSASPAGHIPNPSAGGLQWDQARVGSFQAWAAGHTGSKRTTVAVLDTGVAWNHPDLAPNVVLAACASVFGACNPYPNHWHGTHVAGTVAGYGGVVGGVGPDLGVASYNVFEANGLAYDWSIWVSVVDAVNRGIQVINMSLGGYVVKPNSKADVATWTAWNRAAVWARNNGTTIVASAGNDAFNLNGPVSHIPSDLPSVFSVGATGISSSPTAPWGTFKDVLAFYSNTGAAVDISAPGGDFGPAGTPYPFPAVYHLVLSSFVDVTPTSACRATFSCPIGWAWAAGTSMASPHVAGAAGLVKDQDQSLNPNQVKAILKQSADKTGKRQNFGHGILNVPAALGL